MIDHSGRIRCREGLEGRAEKAFQFSDPRDGRHPGCRMPKLFVGPVDTRDDVFDHNSRPDDTFLVGSGYFIIYRADVEGELFLVDAASERLLATASLQPGEEHEMIYDIRDKKLAANLDALGIDPQRSSSSCSLFHAVNQKEHSMLRPADGRTLLPEF